MAAGTAGRDGMRMQVGGMACEVETLLLEAGMSLEPSGEWLMEKQGDSVSLQFVAQSSSSKTEISCIQ